MENQWILGLMLGLVPMVGWVVWWWNEIRYVRPIKARCSAKLPPGHLGLPFLGETLSFLWFFKIVDRPDDFINSKKIKYGDNVGAYRTHLFGSPSIVACSPSLCKLVLNSIDKFKQEWPTTEVLGSNSVFTLEGKHHGFIKSYIVNYINRPDSISEFQIQAQPDIVEALQLWSQKPKITAIHQLEILTLDFTMRYIAGFQARSCTETTALLNLFKGVSNGIRAQPWNFPGTTYYHALKCRKTIMTKLKEELEKRKQLNEKNKCVAGESAHDFMDGLMQIKDKEGKHLSDEEILDNVLITILVGHKFIALITTWALYLLAKSPHVLGKLREENTAMLRKNNNRSVTYEDIMKLKYTNKVVEETLRVASVSAFVFRKATIDIDYQGYMIPKGWSVLVWLRHLHNDPTNFENPKSFNPDRWDTRPKSGMFLPFGAGPRNCAGNMFARVSICLFLHHFSVGYKWELLNPDVKIKYLPYPLPSDGLQISISRLG